MPNREISAKFKIEGLAEIKSSLATLNTEIGLHKAELEKLDVQYAGQQNSVEALTAKQNVLKQAHEAQAQKLQTLNTAAQAAQRVTENYATAIDKQKEKIAATKSELEKLKDSTGDTSTEQKALTEILKSQQKELEKLENGNQKAERSVLSYQKQIAGTETSLLALDKELEDNERYLQECAEANSLCATSIDGYGKSVKQAGEDAEEAGEQSQSFGERSSAAIDALSASLAAGIIQKGFSEIKDLLVDCIDTAAEFETAMAKAQTLAGAENVGQMSRDILEASTNLGVSATQLSEAAYQAMSAGQDAGNAVEFSVEATKLSMGGYTDAATAVDVLTTALNAYKLEADQTSRVADMLITTQNLGKTSVNELASSMGKVIPVASAFDVELDNLSTAYANLTANGISTRNATTYLSAMLNELGDSGSTVSSVLMDKTGKSFSELNREGKSLGDIIAILGDSVDGDSAAFNELWSSSQAGVGALSLLGNGAEKYNETLEAMRNSVGAANEAFEIMSGTTEHAQERMRVAADNLKIAIGDQLTPIISSAAEKGTDLLQWATDFVTEHPAVVKALTALTVALGVFSGALALAKAAVMLLTLAMETNPFVLAATAIMGVVTAIGVLVSSADDGRKSVQELTDEYTASARALRDAADGYKEASRTSEAEINATAATAEKLIARMTELEGSVGDNAEASQEYRAIVSTLNELIPDLNLVIDEQTGLVEGDTQSILDNTEAWRLNAIEQAKNEALADVYKKYADAQVELAVKQQKLKDSTKALTEAREAETAIAERMAELEEETAAIYAENNDLSEEQIEHIHAMQGEYENLAVRQGEARNTTVELEIETEALNDAIRIGEEVTGSCKDEISLYERALNEAADAAGDAAGAVEEETEAEKENAEAADDAAEAAERFAAAQWDIDQNARKAHEALSTMTDELQALMDEYSAAYEAAYKSIDGQIGLFDRMEVEVTTSVDDMLTSLESQIAYMDTYAENLQKAAEMGVSEGLLKELSDGSTESAAYLEEIVNNGGDKIGELNEKFAKVEEGKQEFAEQVAEMETNFKERMEDIVEDAADAVEAMNLAEEARRSAAYTIEGYLEGLEEKAPGLYASMERISSRAGQYWDRGLRINSPSRVLRESGQFTIEGYLLGVEDMQGALEDTLDRVTDLIKEAFPKDKDGQELAKKFVDAYTDQLSDAQSAVAAIESQITSMESKLMGYGELTETVAHTWADGSKTEYLDASTLEKQTERIQEYAEMLDQLQDRGINPSLMREVLGMGVDDAVKYGSMLLDMDAGNWDKYMAAYARKMEVSAEIAQKYYGAELADAQDFLAAMENVVSADAADAGASVVQSLIAGMQAQEDALKQEAESLAEMITTAIQGGGKGVTAMSFDDLWQRESETVQAAAASAIPTVTTEPAASSVKDLLQSQTEAYVSGQLSMAGMMQSVPKELVVNLTSELDGATLARNQYRYNLAESSRRGRSLVTGG